MKIDFNGIDYEHEASISDEWGGLCKILYKPKELDKRKHVIEPAEGVSVKGTKKIK